MRVALPVGRYSSVVPLSTITGNCVVLTVAGEANLLHESVLT